MRKEVSYRDAPNKRGPSNPTEGTFGAKDQSFAQTGGRTDKLSIDYIRPLKENKACREIDLNSSLLHYIQGERPIINSHGAASTTYNNNNINNNNNNNFNNQPQFTTQKESNEMRYLGCVSISIGQIFHFLFSLIPYIICR